MTASLEVQRLIGEHWPEMEAPTVQRVVQFYERIVVENQIQNLTRLTSPRDFVDGHVLDVRELLRSGLAEYPAMDLGSGAGVPGLLAALVRPDSWLLVESEGAKARFLEKTCQEMNLKNVQVFPLRGEAVLESHRVQSVVSRAVGPVLRIYGWIRQCSTWNNLVLFKGPRWEEEWREFSNSKFRSELRLDRSHSYTSLDGTKHRIIVKLAR